jgi:hypothetical protein
VKKIGIVIVCIVLSSFFLPTVFAENENDELNLRVEIGPFRKAFPRVYTLLVVAQFHYTYYCENGSYGGGSNLTFQVTRLADNEIVHSEIIEMDPLHSYGHGAIVDYTCYKGMRRFVSLYEAKVILNVEDSDTSDNVDSCYFIVIETI